ncbi:MAG TPA: hypothetical protein VN873_19500 [Candidatus Angelobacter sp.]|nr:hypothetical protein [Candidatus Angelobacter sp.]
MTKGTLAMASSTNSAAPDTLRDIKPPVDIPNVWLWVWIGVAIVAFIALVIGLILYFRMRRKQVPAVPPIPPHIRAKQKLEEALALLAQPKPFCIMVSDTVRSYLEDRFTFHAPERTTEEFLHELQATNLLLPDQKESLGEFLKSCDLVKFARYEPREAELRGLHDSAVRLVEETEPPPLPADAANATRNPQQVSA